MVENSEKGPGWAGGPLYKQGVAHFEAEEWEQAISAFSRLASEFPDDQELQQILADLRLKASLPLEETLRGRMRMRVRRLGRPALLVLGVVALIAVLAGVSYFIYTSWLLPARTVRDQQTHLRELHELAKGYLAAGEYDQAADLYRQILSEAPDDATAAAGLERVEELQELATAYDRALELTQEERWDEALEAWQAILAVDPNFRDVKYWTAFVQEQDVVGSLFVEAERRYESEDWSGAIEVLEDLRAQDMNYRRDEVEALLVSSLVNLAEQILSDAPDPAEVHSQVMELFDKAIQISPQNESVLSQRAVAEGYLHGCALFQEEDWEEAIEELQFVCEHELGYAGGHAVELLYQANLNCGDERAQAGDLQGALACYQAAGELPVDDTSEATARYAALLPSLTATPTTRRPASTATPTQPPRPPTPTPTRSPYSFHYVTGSAQPLSRPGCPAPSIQGRVLDAAGIGLQGVWVRLEWWNNHEEKMTGYDGEFGFAPLSIEHFADAVPFKVTVIRSPGDPSALSPTITLDFPGCDHGDHSGFTNVIFKAVQ
jgi:tetratricopeptide (TPR) repeat protein